MSVTDETKAVAPEAATAPSEADTTKKDTKSNVQPEEDTPKTDEAQPSTESEVEKGELKEDEEESVAVARTAAAAAAAATATVPVASNDGEDFNAVDKEDEDDEDEDYEQRVAKKRERNEKYIKGRFGGLLPTKPDNNSKAKPTKRKSKMPSKPTRSQPSRSAKSGKQYGDEFEEEKKPKAKSGKRKSSKKELDCEPEKKKRSTAPKDEMKEKVIEFEKMGVDDWCDQYEPMPPKKCLPKYCEDLKIDGKLVSEFTEEDVRAIDVGKLDEYHCKKMQGLLCIVGGKTRGDTTEVRSRLKHYIETGEVEKGCRKADMSQFMRQTESSFRKEGKLNVLSVLFDIPLIDKRHAEMVKIVKGKIVIAATAKGTTPSNLQYVADMMGDASGINGSIKTMMKSFTHCRFLIGPSNHGYYKNISAPSKLYENDELELIHPDITPDYQPNDHDGKMRRF